MFLFLSKTNFHLYKWARLLLSLFTFFRLFIYDDVQKAGEGSRGGVKYWGLPLFHLRSKLPSKCHKRSHMNKVWPFWVTEIKWGILSHFRWFIMWECKHNMSVTVWNLAVGTMRYASCKGKGKVHVMDGCDGMQSRYQAKIFKNF